MNKLKQRKKEERKKDKEWRKIVLEKYENCVICGDKNRPNAHHIIPKNFKETRWDIENGIILCPKHHKFGKFSAHKNGLWFINWLKTACPEKYKYLSNKLKEIENGNNC